jgi:pimeloyl-ACP methyl ester carboxylesterase
MTRTWKALLLVAVAGPLRAQAPDPPGSVVDLDGYGLHLWCQGTGAPTVVLSAGAGDYSFDWEPVMEGLRSHVRVCSYDRPGFAWSAVGPVPRTMAQEAFEIRTALRRAGERGPYVLVGHSVGGLIARVFAHAYPDDVAGLVLVDPTHEDTRLMYQGRIVRVRDSARPVDVPRPTTYAASPPRAPTAQQEKDFADMRASMGAPRIEPPFDRLSPRARAWRLWALGAMRPLPEDEYWPEELTALAQRRREDELDGLPVGIVLPASRPLPPSAPAEEREMMAEKQAQKEGLVQLSRNAVLIRANSTGHHVHLEQPAVVIEAVRRVIALARGPAGAGVPELGRGGR